MNIHAQKQRKGRKPWSYLDRFRGLTLDVMGHTSSLIHVSGPWTVHNPRLEFQDELEICSPLLDFSWGCCCCCCYCCCFCFCCFCCFLTPEAETLSDWRDLYLSPKKSIHLVHHSQSSWRYAIEN